MDFPLHVQIHRAFLLFYFFFRQAHNMCDALKQATSDDYLNPMVSDSGNPDVRFFFSLFALLFFFPHRIYSYAVTTDIIMFG